MSEKPEYVTCVIKADGETFCGERAGMSFCFQNIDALRANILAEGRLQVCRECAEQIIVRLTNQIESQP